MKVFNELPVHSVLFFLINYFVEQAPTQSITTLSSDSELSGDKSPAKDNSTDFNKDMKLRSSNTLEADEEEDEKICSIALKSPNKKATKKIVGGVTPAKRKRTIEHENGGMSMISSFNLDTSSYEHHGYNCFK